MKSININPILFVEIQEGHTSNEGTNIHENTFIIVYKLGSTKMRCDLYCVLIYLGYRRRNQNNQTNVLINKQMQLDKGSMNLTCRI